MYGWRCYNIATIASNIQTLTEVLLVADLDAFRAHKLGVGAIGESVASGVVACVEGAAAEGREGVDGVPIVSIPLRVLVESLDGQPITSAAGLAALVEVDAMLVSQPEVARTLSVLDVLRSLPGSDEREMTDAARKFLPFVPAGARARLLGMGGRAALVSANVRDDGAAALEPVFHSIEENLDEIRSRHPGFDMRLTGVTYISASISLAARITSPATSVVRGRRSSKSSSLVIAPCGTRPLGQSSSFTISAVSGTPKLMSFSAT